MRAVLYDVHGNLVALEAVLEQAERAGATAFVLGGDYSAFGPWPRQTLERLRELEDAVWIRGNGERWLREPPDIEEVQVALEVARDELGGEDVERLVALPPQAEVDGVLFCHGSPLSDVDSFAADSDDEEDERLLAGVRERTVVFGHSHLQFERAGPGGTRLVNPGSVGMPLDGDTRAAWATFENGELELRRTEYDLERVVARVEGVAEWSAMIAKRLRNAGD